MTSILKVDQLQDSGGNAILTSDGAGSITTSSALNTAITNAGFITSGGITEADLWRLTTNITADTDPISANLERVDDTSFAKIGTGMSVSSGVWTFPSTGLYQVGHNTSITGTTGDTVGFALSATQDNGSNWDDLCNAYQGGSGVSGDNGSSVSNFSFVNVTDTSNVKVKFYVYSITAGSRVNSSTDTNFTSFFFIRLGDSQ